ncbi:MAG: hypothetical protein OXC31_16470 [Spirochaetaceae bacterium]|nr:hypothetical protein [Spirochaetaceae bacterium]
MEGQPKDRTYSADFRAGLIGLLAGENLAKATNRVLEQARRDGQRLVFMVRDQWSIWRWLLSFIGFAISLGLWGRLPGYLLVTETVAASDKEEPRPAEPPRPQQQRQTPPEQSDATLRDKALAYVRDADGPATVTAVASHVGCDASRASRLLGALVQDSLIAARERSGKNATYSAR